MTLIGILIIVNSLIMTAYWVIGEHANKQWALGICLIGIFSGVVFLLQDRALEITLKSIGTIKAAAKQATVDAGNIAKIKERIEAQSATIDSVAKSAADTRKTTDEISQKNIQIETKIKEFNNLTLEASNKLKEIETMTEFLKVTTAAENDDRNALNKLLPWIADESFLMRKEAANVYTKIRTDYTSPIERGYLNFNWPANTETAKLTIKDLRELYKNSTSLYHAYFVNFIHDRADISKKEKMAFFIDVIKDDESLTATYYAGKFFAEATGIKWSPFVVQPHIDWWEKNKETIEP